MSRLPWLGRWLEALRGRPHPPRAVVAPPLRARLLSLDLDGPCHAEPAIVERLAFSADGQRVVSACVWQPSLCTWSAEGRCLARLEAPRGAGHLVSWELSRDGTRCVSTHEGEPWAAHVWDLERGTCVGPLTGLRGEHLAQLCLDPAGERALVLSYAQPLMDPDVKSWRMSVVELREPHAVRDLAAMEDTYAVGSVAMHPDGSRVFVATHGIVEVWDLATSRRLGILEGAGGSPELVLDAAGARCVVGTREGRVRVWDTASGQRAADLDVGTRYALVRLLPDETRALVAGHDGPPRVWDLERGVPLHAIGDVSLRRDRFVMDRAGSLLAIHDGERGIDVWDVTRGERLARVALERRPSAFAIARDVDGVVRVALGEGARVRMSILSPAETVRDARG